MRPTRVLVPITMCGLALALAGCSSEQQSQIPSATRATTVDLYTHCGIRYLQVGPAGSSGWAAGWSRMATRRPAGAIRVSPAG
jgi:hypothetical protein